MRSLRAALLVFGGCARALASALILSLGATHTNSLDLTQSSRKDLPLQQHSSNFSPDHRAHPYI